MQVAMLTAEQQAAFFRSADNIQRVAQQHLDARPDEGAVIAFVQRLQAGVEKVLTAAVAQGAHIDCQAGCSHCCSAQVRAFAPEIFQIVDELHTRSQEEQQQLIARLRAHAAFGAQDTAPWSLRRSCSFLVDSLCTIYPVRPSACRKAHSIDVRACETQAATIPQHLTVVLQAEAMMAGVSRAYTHQGFDGAAYELVRAVLATWDNPDAKRRWHAGATNPWASDPAT